MASESKVAVYIGRFQPFHLGHAHVLKTAMQENDFVIVLVGSSFQARTIKNPWDVSERFIMIDNWWNNSTRSSKCGLKVVAVPDQPYNNAKWIQTVQEKVSNVLRDYSLRNATITLYGSDRDDTTWYLSAFPQWKKRMLDPIPLGSNLSATKLREYLFTGNHTRMWDDLPETTIQFIDKWIGIDARIRGETDKISPVYQTLIDEYKYIDGYKKKWQHAPHPPTFVTVDAVVIQSGHVLVVERGNMPGRGLWALPGGFVNQNELLLDASIRELIEETGIRLADGKRAEEITKDILRNAVKGKEIFDQPERSLRGRTITTAFFFRLDDTKPLPKVKGQNMPLHETGGAEVVETVKAFWLPINEARSNHSRWFEDHVHILDTFIGGKDA